MILKISASAGAGKTYTLTRHFLELLDKAGPGATLSGCAAARHDAGYSLAEILAATFTNKSAAEMKSRVINTLKERALRDHARKEKPGAGDSMGTNEDACADLLSHGRAELWVERILRHYGSLNIRTIDSLLATLVRLSTLELGLPPDFESSFDAKEYFSPLYDALMEDLAFVSPASEKSQSEPAPDFCRRNEGQSADSALFSRAVFFLSADAAQLRKALEDACQSLLYFTEVKGFTPKRRLHDLLLDLVTRLLRGKETPTVDSAAVHARLHALHMGLVRAVAHMQEMLATEHLKAGAHFINFLTRCAQSSPYAPLPQSAFAQKTDLDACLLKASQGTASPEATACFQTFLGCIAKFSLSLPIFKHALQLAPLILLAREIFCRIEARQSVDRLLPAIRLPLLAARVLSEEHGVSDALCRLGSRLSRIMLDEFQDTSKEQWEVILPLAVESLSRGGSLTYVGDVKQAIYGWRGGDIRLFESVPHDPALRALTPHPQEWRLEHNWRSHPDVVAHNNAFFSLLGRQDIALKTLTAMLPEKTPERWLNLAAEETTRNFSQVRQKIPPEKDWKKDPQSRHALVRLYEVEAENSEAVRDLVQQRLHRLFFTELLPAWQYGDIAVLARSGKEAALVAGWLAAWGLPVVTENSFLLASHPLVNGLISFLSFLDYPLDDLAFWEFAGKARTFVSRSHPPHSAQEKTPEEGLFATMPLPGPDWPAAKTLEFGKKRPALHHLFRAEFPVAWNALIAPFYNEAGIMSAYDTLREILRRFDLPRRMPGHAPFFQRLLELAHLAETQGHSSLAAFLAFWRDCKEDEKLPLPEAMDAVRIMTIHKAKGLEFPVVVLPFQHKGEQRDPELALVEYQGLRLLTRVEKGLEEEYYTARITDEAERLNLLYVAWTRAVYALHAFVTRPRTASSPLSRALSCLLAAHREQNEELCQWERLTIAADGLCSPLTDTSHSKFALANNAPAPDMAPAAQAPQVHSPARAQGGSPPPDEFAAHDPLLSPDLPWQPMDWLPRLKIYRSSLEGTALTPRRKGILTHLCLEHLFLSDRPGDREKTLQEDIRRAVQQGMRLFPLPLEQSEKLALDMEESLFWFASLPHASMWLSVGLREQGIVDAHGNMHRVDLLADEALYGEKKTKEPALYALDYKTGYDAAPAGRQEHREQMRRYMHLVAQAQGRPVRGILVYLDERRLEEVSTCQD